MDKNARIRCIQIIACIANARRCVDAGLLFRRGRWRAAAHCNPGTAADMPAIGTITGAAIGAWRRRAG
ncbi:MAG: hypothetical protein ACK4UO_17590 [Pseudolabrys sp.]